MGIGDSLRVIMGARFEPILRDWGEPLTIVRSPTNVVFTGYIDRPQLDRDMAARTHEYDLVMRQGDPTGAPLAPGELVQDPAGVYYLLKVLRQEPPIALGTLWRCNAVGTIWRSGKGRNTITGVTTSTQAPAVTGVRCRISMHPGTGAAQTEGHPLQLESRWVTQESFSIAAAAGVLQAGDEIEAPGWPRLKVGRPAMGDAGDPSWEVPATPVLPRGVPGPEV